MKKILILGGTNFIGRNLVEQLQHSSEFELTLFNRGNTNPHLFPNIKKIIGDRKTKDIQQLSSEQYDVVIDISCYYPDDLRNVLKVLKPPKRYILISSCSVYQHSEVELKDETQPILTCIEEEGRDTTSATYGKRKAECDNILLQSNLDYIILRPSIVYGAYDYTDRFYYWLYQVQNHDPLLVPDEGRRFFSCTYVLDLTQAIMKSITIPSHNKVYNVISNTQISIGEIIKTGERLLEKSPNHINVTPQFLHNKKIAQWTEMPLWIDSDAYTYATDKLIQDFDFSYTKLSQGLQTTIEYHNQIDWSVPKYGMPETKRQILIEELRIEN